MSRQLTIPKDIDEPTHNTADILETDLTHAERVAELVKVIKTVADTNRGGRYLLPQNLRDKVQGSLAILQGLALEGPEFRTKPSTEEAGTNTSTFVCCGIVHTPPLEQLPARGQTVERPTTPAPLSFAEVLRNNNKPSLIIKPKSKRPPGDLRKELQAKVPLNQIPVVVQRIQTTNQGGLEVFCNTPDDVDQLRSYLQKAEIDIEVTRKEKRRPRIAVHNVHNTTKPEELIDELSSAAGVSAKQLKPLFRLRERNAKRVKWILECSPEAFRAAITMRRIFTGWQSHGISEFLGIRRCYRCQQFGHSQDICKSSKLMPQNVLYTRGQCRQSGPPQNTEQDSTHDTTTDAQSPQQPGSNTEHVINATVTDQHPTIRCLQTNLQRAHAATSQAAVYVANENIDIILGQEPYHKEGKLVGFPLQWNTYQRTDAALPPRSFITICNPTWSPIIIMAERDCVAILLEVCNLTILLVSLYSPPTEEAGPTIERLQHLMNHHRTEHVLIAGDFNAHSTTWGYADSTPKGRCIEDFLNSWNLAIHNDPEGPPTFETIHARGWPDLTVTSHQLAPLIQDWTVVQEISLSDHNYIRFDIAKSTSVRIIKRYNLPGRKARAFTTAVTSRLAPLETAIQQANSSDDLEKITQELLKIIQTVCDEQLPQRVARRIKQLHWWNGALRTQQRKCRALRRRLKTERRLGRDTPTLIIYQRERASYKRMILQAKKDSWQKFCTESRDTYGLHHLIATGKLFKPANMQLIPTADGDSNLTADTLKTILNTVFTTDDPLEDTIEQAITRNQAPTLDTKNDPPITIREILTVLHQLPQRKAPGPDGIDYRIIKQVIRANTSLFMALFNKLLDTGTFPSCFKIGQVVLFLKKHRDPAHPESYRPICLLSALGKVFEKILMSRLRHHLYVTRYLSPTQHGFSPGKSTLNALLEVKDEILENRLAGHHTAFISIDLKSAFDTLWWPAILQALRSANCPLNIYKVLTNYLTDRSLILPHNSGIISKRQTQGCPQGSCAGPFLWNVTFNEVLKQSWPAHTKIIAYADDTALVVKGQTRRQLQANAIESCTLFQERCNRLKLRIAEAKSKILLIPKKGGSLARQPRITLNGQRLKITKELKYLGIIFDSKLNWIPHVLELKKRTMSIAQQLKYMQGGQWGLNPHIQKILYKTVTEKIITYGAAVWSSPMQGRKVRHLASMQRPFLLNITKAFCTSPTNALNVLAGLPPLHLTVEREATYQLVAQLGRLATFQNETHDPKDFEIKLVRLQDHPAHHGEGVNVKIKQNINAAEDTTSYYTDGSRIDNSTGCAYVSIKNREQVGKWKGHLSPENSVFQSEAMAIARAIQEIIRQGQRDVTIFTDSLSSLHAILNPMHSSPLVAKIQRFLKDHSHLRIKLAWVKAHVGNVGNELADQLAKEAAQNIEAEEIQLSRPISWLKRRLIQAVNAKWQQVWDMGDTGRRAHYHLPKVNQDHLTANAQLVRFITGHGPFPAYFGKHGTADSDQCICGETGTPEHYVSACPLTAQWHLPIPETNTQAFFWNEVKDTCMVCMVCEEKYMKTFKNNIEWFDNLEQIVVFQGKAGLANVLNLDVAVEEIAELVDYTDGEL
ncbi:Hypothetical protein in type-1 retrotransposable element R1DM, partial [Stegodyphus mimosarum]